MKYRTLQKNGYFFPQYKTFLRWKYFEGYRIDDDIWLKKISYSIVGFPTLIDSENFLDCLINKTVEYRGQLIRCYYDRFNTSVYTASILESHNLGTTVKVYRCFTNLEECKERIDRELKTEAINKIRQTYPFNK